MIRSILGLMLVVAVVVVAVLFTRDLWSKYVSKDCGCSDSNPMSKKG